MNIKQWQFTQKRCSKLLASALGNVRHIIMQGRGLMALVQFHTHLFSRVYNLLWVYSYLSIFSWMPPIYVICQCNGGCVVCTLDMQVLKLKATQNKHAQHRRRLRFPNTSRGQGNWSELPQTDINIKYWNILGGNENSKVHYEINIQQERHKWKQLSVWFNY